MLQGVPGAPWEHTGRLDAFVHEWHSMCGDQLAFSLCPQFYDARLGPDFGLTENMATCLRKASADGVSVCGFLNDIPGPCAEPDVHVWPRMLFVIKYCRLSGRKTLFITAGWIERQ